MTEPKLGESPWRVVDRVLVEHARRMDAQQEHLKAHDETNEINDRRIDRIVGAIKDDRLRREKADEVRDARIDKLVERLDRAYTKIHALERKTRGLNES